MKRQAVLYSALAVTILFTVGVPVCAFAADLNANKYYTWGISGDDVTIPDGSIITEAVLTIHGLTSLTDDTNDNLLIYCIDDPPVGFIANVAAAGVDHFKRHGFRLVPDFQDSKIGTQQLTSRFSSINDPKSWAWKIFEYPFEFALADSTSVNLSSSLLELIDYAGNGTPFGIGLAPEGTNSFSFKGITLELTVNTFEGDPAQSVLIYSYGETNRPPVMEDVPFMVEIEEGNLLTFSVIATDPDNDKITYSAMRLPDDASYVDGIFKWTPSYDLTTQNTPRYEILTFIASDGNLGDSKTVLVRVINTNQNPILNPIGNKTVSENENLSFSVSGTDPDGDDVEFKAPILPEGAAFDNNIFSWTPGFDQSRAQTYSVLVFAVDKQQAFDSELVRITVNNTNRPPVIEDIPLEMDIKEGSCLTLSIIATDPDNDEISFSATGLPDNASLQNGIFKWIPSYDLTTQNTPRYEIVTFIASDGNLEDSITVKIGVVNSK